MRVGFPSELNAAIDAGVTKYGPLELSKRFLFHYMRENGVTYGDAWQCVIELSESSFEDYERIQNSFAELDNETGIPDFHPPVITFSTPIASLDDARKAVAARKDLDRPLALFDTWGFESPTQFLVVAIPFQDYSETGEYTVPNQPFYNCIVDKTDGKAYTTDLKNTDIFAHFGKNGVRVVSMTGKDKVLWHEWSRTMLETLPPYPGESY